MVLPAVLSAGVGLLAKGESRWDWVGPGWAGLMGMYHSGM